MQWKGRLMRAPLAALLLTAGAAVRAQNPPEATPPADCNRECRERLRRAERERDAIHQKQTRDGRAGRQLEDVRRTERQEELEVALLSAADVRNAERGLTVSLDASVFESDDRLNEASLPRVSKIGAILAAQPGARVQVLGYVDPADDEEQRRVAERRAAAIRDLLVAAGVSGGQVTSRVISDARPLTSSDTTAGRQSNRRVEIVVTDIGAS